MLLMLFSVQWLSKSLVVETNVPYFAVFMLLLYDMRASKRQALRKQKKNVSLAGNLYILNYYSIFVRIHT